MVDGKETKMTDGSRHRITGNIQDHQTSQVLYTSNPTILTTYVSRQQLQEFDGAKFYSPHALVDENQHIRTKENMVEFSSTVIPILCPYQKIKHLNSQNQAEI